VTRINQIKKGEYSPSHVIVNLSLSLSLHTLSVKECKFEESILDPTVMKW
jgi:hypothetical protein